LNNLDGLSGATITSRAAIETINQTATDGLKRFFNRSWPQQKIEKKGILKYVNAKLVLVTFLLFVFVHVHMKAGKWERMAYQLASLLGLGFIYNILITEVDIANFGLGHFSSWQGNPGWWMLAGVALFATFGFGQAYCGLICPYGALQEFISRLGKKLGISMTPNSEWETVGRYWKFFLLAMVLSVVWLSSEVLWISFNPMQKFFSFSMEPIMWAIAGLSLAGSLFFFRFWCRYWCPLGAFFALGNKLAFFDRFVRKRSFNRCDLGVSHTYDVDCIRCNRCITELPNRQKEEAKPLASNMFLVFMLVMGMLIAADIWAKLDDGTDQIGGWRKIDTQKVRSQVGEGRLHNREAQWWRPAKQSEIIDEKSTSQ
ncbi:MAG: 4Fe-4S binding protein, partial [Magnetococcales bacterium]|nr:4Fe-4S binding protein [Magnetococcales bacterium]